MLREQLPCCTRVQSAQPCKPTCPLGPIMKLELPHVMMVDRPKSDIWPPFTSASLAVLHPTTHNAPSPISCSRHPSFAVIWSDQRVPGCDCPVTNNSDSSPTVTQSYSVPMAGVPVSQPNWLARARAQAKPDTVQSLNSDLHAVLTTLRKAKGHRAMTVAEIEAACGVVRRAACGANDVNFCPHAEARSLGQALEGYLVLRERLLANPKVLAHPGDQFSYNVRVCALGSFRAPPLIIPLAFYSLFTRLMTRPACLIWSTPCRKACALLISRILTRQCTRMWMIWCKPGKSSLLAARTTEAWFCSRGEAGLCAR